MTTIPGAGTGPVLRAGRRAGRFLVRGLASLAAMFGVLPADHFRAAAKEWDERDGREERDGRGTAPSRSAPGREPPPPWVSPPAGPVPEAGNVWFPWDRAGTGGALPPGGLTPGALTPGARTPGAFPLDAPPPAHPERLVPRPPSEGERALWAQLEGPAPPA
ncbi:DUF6059 family protein [Streptomyces yaizuensis]|uniref:Uncharacterized protein n=1 Tax=Streptomyces yaizuensis TaxID=2989713 RepID=A0ABQ5NZH4_9ACTN|nr:DUF6059 family protein [Streptomyces sp. YSPA8]GLF95600.1 hypothetical protein SYYSPA8_14905 [Streptomyces sp. YSPA8]